MCNVQYPGPFKLLIAHCSLLIGHWRPRNGSFMASSLFLSDLLTGHEPWRSTQSAIRNPQSAIRKLAFPRFHPYAEVVERMLANALGEDLTKLAAEEKQRLLSRLVARLAHEIRNPLSSLDIHVQLLEEDLVHLAPQTKEKLSGRLEIIHGELHRLENIVKQFLRLAGPSALDLAAVDLAKVVERVCGLLRPEAAARQIEIVTRLAGDLPPVKADPDQLIQALLNLVINALQAIEKQGRVEVRVARAGDALLLEVGDSGPGVPPERLSTIFEPYYTTKPEGSGLGLWIAQQIIIAHGGTLQVANVPGGGAVFAVRLPLVREDKADG